MTEADEHVPARLARAPAEKAARAVLPACAGAWTAAEVMHVTGIPWLDLAFGTAAATAAAYGRGAPRAAKWVMLAGGWSVLAARLGPLADPGLYCPLTLTWAGLSSWGWRQARAHPAVIKAREKRDAAAGWLARRDRWGLSGTHLLDQEPTRLGERYLVDVRGSGKRASQIAGSDVAERIAEDEMLPPGRVRVTRHRLAGRVEILIRRTDPWARPIPHPVLADDPEINLSGPCSVKAPVEIGQDPETGRALLLPLWDERGGKNITAVGQKGAGKTVLLNNVSERVTAASDALMVRVNLSIKGPAEAGRWGPACHLTAFGPQQQGRALKVLRVISGIIEWRSRQEYQTDVFIPSPRDPQVILIMDEINSAAGIPAIRAVLEDIASKGREYGVTLIRSGQRGTAEWTGGGNVRANDDVFCIGMVNRSMEAMHAAGDLGLQLPDMASYGEGHGGVWAVAETGGYQDAGRTFMLKDPPDIARIVSERAWNQPELQPELQAFLGETYEKLLRTDVFARWARDQGERPVAAHPRPDMAPEPEPRGVDPRNPMHAMALMVRDGVVQADDETAGVLGKALEIEERASLDAYDAEAEDALPDDLRARWARQGKRLEEIRRDAAEASAAPAPDLDGVPHDELVARANERWREVGEATSIPDDARAKLLGLLAAGTTISEVARVLEVTKWTARTYLERLRTEGLAQTVGKGRGTRWKSAEGDGS